MFTTASRFRADIAFRGHLIFPNRMLLAIDIGNSAIKVGLFRSSNLIKKTSLQTRTADSTSLKAAISELGSAAFGRVFISSVVPELDELFRGLFPNAVWIDHRSDLGITIVHRTPETLGSDRLVNAAAGAAIYGKPCIICSFGTAATIDAVDADGVFLGGTIAPGIATMAASLHAQTAKLPLVTIEKCESVFGKTTEDAIRSGIFFGYIGLVDGIVSRMKAELGKPATVIAAGGFAEFIAENTGVIDRVDTDLLLKGLNLLAQRA